MYNLYAVVNHVGSTFDGHYTAAAKHPNTGHWHHFDDQRYLPCMRAYCLGRVVHVAG